MRSVGGDEVEEGFVGGEENFEMEYFVDVLKDCVDAISGVGVGEHHELRNTESSSAVKTTEWTGHINIIMTGCCDVCVYYIAV